MEHLVKSSDLWKLFKYFNGIAHSVFKVVLVVVVVMVVEGHLVLMVVVLVVEVLLLFFLVFLSFIIIIKNFADDDELWIFIFKSTSKYIIHQTSVFTTNVMKLLLSFISPSFVLTPLSALTPSSLLILTLNFKRIILIFYKTSFLKLTT